MTHKYDTFYNLLTLQREAELAAYEHARLLGLTATRDKLLRNVQATGLIINDVLTKIEAAAIGDSLSDIRRANMGVIRPMTHDEMRELAVQLKTPDTIGAMTPICDGNACNTALTLGAATRSRVEAEIQAARECSTDTPSQPDQGACSE